jgi:hypothetical protein
MADGNDVIASGTFWRVIGGLAVFGLAIFSYAITQIDTLQSDVTEMYKEITEIKVLVARIEGRIK